MHLITQLAGIFLVLGIMTGRTTSDLQICSYGQVERKYYAESEMCCFGLVEKRERDKDCCYSSRRFYNASSHVCCDGGVLPIETRLIPYFGHYPIPSTCCGSELINRLDEKNEKKKCCDNPMDRAQSKVYNPHNSFCCNGNIYRKEENQGCCNGQAYNKDIHLCCKGHLISHIHGLGLTECCAGSPQGVIDKTKQVCISDEPFDSECTTEYGTILPPPKCCGQRWRVDLGTQKCCQYEVVSKNVTCCDGYGLRSNQVCCETFGPKDKLDLSEDACCEGSSTYALYNSKIARCRGRAVQMYETCNKKKFNPEEKICCGGYLSKRYRDSVCCDNKAISERYFRCCNGRIQRKSQSCDNHVQ